MNKKFYIKKNLIGFIIGAFIVSISSVLALTYFPSSSTIYDNSDSGMTSTNVQDAINELYKVCSIKKVNIGGQNVPIVTEGDGLYEDEYETGKYTYKGANPNNYITFNNERAGWRIIAVNPDRSLKIMKIIRVADTGFDNQLSNWWSRAWLNDYLNEDYYTEELDSIAQGQIMNARYNSGRISGGKYSEPDNTLESIINKENSAYWTGKIALPTVSEYMRANSNMTDCNTVESLEDYRKNCRNTNWMYIDNDWWTMIGDSDESDYAFMINAAGHVESDTVNHGNWVRPVVTLPSSVNITGGNGTQTNPFTVS